MLTLRASLLLLLLLELLRLGGFEGAGMETQLCCWRREE